MVQGTLRVNTEKILPIIKKWLYSDRDIFIRELVSNACDALQKLKILRDQKEVDLADTEFRVEITTDKKAQTLKINDTGIGMTGEEVEKYIAQLAFSGAEEFISKYQSKDEKDQIIGHFGLGFYSAYMVAEKVEIQTLSYLEKAEAAFWSCDGSSTYSLEQGSRNTRGTEITLYIDKDNTEYLEEQRLREILNHYCVFLPFPIYLNGKQINEQQPLWISSPTECTDKQYLDFYRLLYPMEPNPIFWIHVNVDYPFHLKGILYFPRIHKRFDFAENRIKLFCNRVFVSDNCKDLLPDYLSMLRGAIDSPDIPLNVSRSYLQMDKTVRQLATHISKKVADRLSTLYRTEKNKFLEAWENIEVVIKLGAIQDEKFYERCKEFLIWKNDSGEWTTIEEYLGRRKENHSDKVFYSTQELTDSSFLNLYKKKGIEVLQANGPVDTALINFLESKQTSTKFQRIDGGLDASLIDSSREKTLLDAQGKSEAAQISDYIRKALNLNHVEVEAKSLAAEELPAFILLKEEERRMRDYFLLSGQSLPEQIADKKTFVVNTNNKIIHQIYYAMREKNPELAKDLLMQVYELALIGQMEFSAENLSRFVNRSNQILEKLLLRDC